MAANTKAKASPYGELDEVSYTEFQTIHDQAYQSVNRTNTITAWKSVPLCYCGGPAGGEGVDKGSAVHFHGTAFDNDTLSDVETPAAYFDLTGCLPDGHVVDGIRASFKPAVHGSLPDHQPILSFLRTKFDTCATSTLATIQCEDQGYNAVGYSLGFTLSTTFSSVTVDKSDYRYFAYVIGEYGANSENGLALGGIQMHVTVDTTPGGPDFLFW